MMNYLKTFLNNDDNPKSDLRSHRAQLIWSLFVAAAIAFVAIQQISTSHAPVERYPAAETSPMPRAPLSQDQLRSPELENSLK